MGYAVLAAWVVQAAAGVVLLTGWARRAGGSGAGLVAVHALSMVAYLTPWVAFLLTGAVWWAWIALAVLLAGIPFGDAMMVRRSRRAHGETDPGLRDYGTAIGAVFRGRLPALVVFHALFAPVVFFGTLGVAIGATVAAA